MRTAVVLTALLLTATLALAADERPLGESKQVILVVTPGWDSNDGLLRRFDRGSAGWNQAGETIPVKMGRSGLAWGKGINRTTGSGPVKREGDGKSPAGVFKVGKAFGFAQSLAKVRLPYLQLKETTECIDDVKSDSYNRIVERTPQADWTSSERMRSIGVYREGAVILHNDPPQKAAGSCIFLHIVDANGKPTSGCTSMAEPALLKLLEWINPSAKPVVVQLPQAEYERLRQQWQLP